MSTIIETMQRAVALQSAGRMEEAASIYQKILREDPNQADAWHLLGLTQMHHKKYDAAIANIKKAIALSPTAAVFHSNLGVVYRFAERFEEAVEAYQVALRLDATNSDTYFNIGKSLKLLGRLDEAEQHFRRSIELNPRKSSPWLSILTMRVDQRRFDDALSLGMQALQYCPKSHELYLSLGAVYKRMQRTEEALQQYYKAVELQPKNLDAICRIAATLITRQRFDEGKKWLDRAIELEPNGMHTLNTLGLLHNTLGNSTAAIEVYRRAVDAYPDYATALANFGTALKNFGSLSEALENLKKSRKLDPSNAETMVVEAGVSLSLGRLQDAEQLFRDAATIKGNFAAAEAGLLMSRQYSPEASIETILADHREWDRKHALPLRDQSYRPRRIDRNKPIRLGFASADLGAHPVGYFTANLFKHIDQSRFETFAYSDRIGRDWLGHIIADASSRWVDSGSWSDDQLAAQIKNDQIDILFDLAGHTAHNRLAVFARRVAPIQVTWAGYVGTTGLSEMDYLLADRFHVPNEFEGFYAERVLRMPGDYISYYPPADSPDVGPLPALRNGFVTFCSMCNPAKVNDEVLDTWGNILQQLPNSRLHLSYCGWPDELNRQRIMNVLAKVIDESRVQFSHDRSVVKLMAHYNSVDIALDTFPYSGGLTTIEALWMGVPTVTWPQKRFASRHSTSHLSNVGLTDWVAASRDAYIEIAVEAANDLNRLSSLRAELRSRLLSSPIGDGVQYAKDFEAIFLQAIDDHNKNLR